MTQVSNKFNHYVDGVLVETTFEDVALPKPTTVESVHELDDGRELQEVDGTDFTPVQRYAQFDYLKNKHHYERKYPSMEEQLDMLYWDKINSTDTFNNNRNDLMYVECFMCVRHTHRTNYLQGTSKVHVHSTPFGILVCSYSLKKTTLTTLTLTRVYYINPHILYYMRT